jgi:pilus assembly protein CpaB
MRARPVLIGVVFALVGVGLLILYLRRYEQEVSGGKRVELLVAVVPIERGTPVTDQMLGTRQVPQAYVDDRAIRATDRDKVLNLRAAAAVPVLQTLAWTDFIATTDDRRDLSSLVQPGNRAMPIRVQFDEVIPMIHPGDFVDVISVSSDFRDATVLLQRVLVLAAGTDTASGGDRDTAKKPAMRATTLTLSVSLPESQLLALAMGNTRLTVVVRNPDDQRVTEAANVSLTSVFDSNKRQTIQSNRRRGPIKLEAEEQKR